jgi:lysylphosphatidylglycerol synthetase-like protein (DUF2156 family)
MQNITAAVTVLAEEAHVVNELPMPAWTVGIGAMVLFLLLLAATMSLRSVGLRHTTSDAVEHHGAGQAGHGHQGGH